MTISVPIQDLLAEYERSLTYTDALWSDLSSDEVMWRPEAESSSIGWHLAHQPAVAHFMLRNLTAAQPQLDPELEALADSATVEADRGDLPDPARISTLRSSVAAAILSGTNTIDSGAVGAPSQLRFVAQVMLIAVINHEYQHSKWIGELRSGPLGHELPPPPISDMLTIIDGYYVVGT